MNRRHFIRAVGAAGAIGAFGGGRNDLFAAGAPDDQAQTAAAQRTTPPEFRQPPTLRKGAQLDSRFPVSFAPTVAEGLRLVTEYFTALSQRDLPALARTLHFPFAIYENIEPVVVQSAADLVANPPPTLNGTGKGRSRIMRGSYDLLESVNVHLYCPVGGAFSLSFMRYTPDGFSATACTP
jgi:hypothetical protein